MATACGHVIDIAPTILSLAGGTWPTSHDDRVVPPTPGKNLDPTFESDQSLDRESIWWLHEGNRAIRSGDWKLVAAKNEPWELYNLGEDRAETNNLASRFPDQVQRLSKLWQTRTDEFVRLRDPSE